MLVKVYVEYTIIPLCIRFVVFSKSYLFLEQLHIRAGIIIQTLFIIFNGTIIILSLGRFFLSMSRKERAQSLYLFFNFIIHSFDYVSANIRILLLSYRTAARGDYYCGGGGEAQHGGGLLDLDPRKGIRCTQILDDHPGGPEIITDSAGEDSTMEFEDTGHSEDCQLKDYYIGEFEGYVAPTKEEKAAAAGGSSMLPMIISVPHRRGGDTL